MVTKRYGYGSIYFDHAPGTECRDARYHRHCTGRWRGEVQLRPVNGKRRVVKVSGNNKTDVENKLAAKREELDEGVTTSADYTVRKCAGDWLAHGLDGRSERTRTLYTDGIEPLLAILGSVPLRDLTATDVRKALVQVAETRSTRTVQIARNCLVRAIRRAQAHNLVRRNVAELAELPSGQEGRPSKALTLDQAKALLDAAEASSLHAYIVLSLLTGIRPEEARALRWDHVDLDGEPPHVDVFRSVRAHGDVKTRTSRRTLAIPDAAVDALRTRHARQAGHRLRAGALWQETDLVFTTRVGTALGANNIRRDFRKVCEAAGLGRGWSPRELRHTFVSLMSEGGVPIEEIARLAGHATTRTTEIVYRKELRPVITTGAEVTAKIFA